MGPRSMSSRLFRAALVLFPRWFRDRYGEEMIANFVGRAEAIGAESGPLAGLSFKLRALLEVPGAALRAFRTGADPDPSSLRVGSDSLRFGDLGSATLWVDDLGQATRSLGRAPGWTGSALLILTLGIGGTTAVFSVLNAVLLRPLPFEQPDELVSMWTVNRVQNLPDGSSWENARDWLQRSRSLEDVAWVFRPEFTNATVTSFGEPERTHVGLVSANFFELLGMSAVAGRVFGTPDLGTDARVAVIGEALWTARYGRDPQAIGHSITIDGEEVRIVGVVPRELDIPRRETQIWRLHDVRTPADSDWRGFDAYWVVGRLRHGFTPAMAQSDLDPITTDLAMEYPATNRNRGVRVESLRSEIVGDRLPLLLWTLFGSMVLVLLIGGTNVAQLMLSRGVDRRRDMAVRASLGATRGRINRQLIMESVLLSAAAGAAGLLLAQLGLRALISLIPPDVPLTDGVRIDRTVLLVGFVVSAVVAPLVGLLPALGASRADASELLRSGGRGSTSRDRRLRSVLVIAEVAMAVVLLAGAGLLVRSAIAIQAVDPGFEARSTLMVRVNLSASEEGPSLQLHEELRDRIEVLPDVLGVGIIGQFFVERIPDQTITFVGHPPREAGTPTPRLTTDQVYPGLFQALGVPLLRGRGLSLSDVGDPNRPHIVVVNQVWVDVFSPREDPVGRQFRWGSQVEGDAITVVGVVGDLRRTTLEEASYPQMFTAGGGTQMDILVMTSREPLSVAPRVREIIRSVDAQAAVSRVSTAWDRYDVGLAPRHFQTMLLGVFAGLAVLLAAIGLFAILHDAVAARRREIGIRIALGAGPAGVRRMVLRQGLWLALAGLGIGLAATLALSGVMGRLVYGIESTDLLTLGAVAGALLAVSVLASALPAWQATRVSPSETLASD